MLIDIIVVVMIVGALGAITLYQVKRKKSGKGSGCGCGCEGCSSYSCPSHTQKPEA